MKYLDLLMHAKANNEYIAEKIAWLSTKVSLAKNIINTQTEFDL